MDKPKPRLFILCMAVIDLSGCLALLPTMMYMEVVEDHVNLDPLCRGFHLMKAAIVPMAAFIMMAIATERFFSICHPRSKWAYVDLPRSRILVAAISVSSAVFGVVNALFNSVNRLVYLVDIPKLEAIGLQGFENSIEPRFRKFIFRNTDRRTLFYNLRQRLEKYREDIAERYPDRNLTGFDQFETDSFMSTFVRSEVAHTGVCQRSYTLVGEEVVAWVDYVQLTFLPLCFLVVSVLYLMIYVHLHRTRPSRLAGMNSGGSRNRLRRLKSNTYRIINVKTAVMFYVIAMTFIILYLPAWLIRSGIVRYRGPVVTSHLYVISFVVNPIVYYFMTGIFKRKIKEICDCEAGCIDMEGDEDGSGEDYEGEDNPVQDWNKKIVDDKTGKTIRRKEETTKEKEEEKKETKAAEERRASCHSAGNECGDDLLPS